MSRQGHGDVSCMSRQGHQDASPQYLAQFTRMTACLKDAFPLSQRGVVGTVLSVPSGYVPSMPCSIYTDDSLSERHFSRESTRYCGDGSQCPVRIRPLNTLLNLHG